MFVKLYFRKRTIVNDESGIPDGKKKRASKTTLSDFSSW